MAVNLEVAHQRIRFIESRDWERYLAKISEPRDQAPSSEWLAGALDERIGFCMDERKGQFGTSYYPRMYIQGISGSFVCLVAAQFPDLPEPKSHKAGEGRLPMWAWLITNRDMILETATDIAPELVIKKTQAELVRDYLASPNSSNGEQLVKNLATARTQFITKPYMPSLARLGGMFDAGFGNILFDEINSSNDKGVVYPTTELLVVYETAHRGILEGLASVYGFPENIRPHQRRKRTGELTHPFTWKIGGYNTEQFLIDIEPYLLLRHPLVLLSLDFLETQKALHTLAYSVEQRGEGGKYVLNEEALALRFSIRERYLLAMKQLKRDLSERFSAA